MKIKIQLITYLYLFLILVTGYIYELFYFYIALIVHELGHILFILLFNKKINKLEISPIGGILFIDECQNDKNYKEFFIYLGGPLFSLILFLFVNKYSTNEMFLNASFYILFLNLLPILPLDGAKLISSLLQNVIWYKLTLKITYLFSIFALFMLLYISIHNLLYTVIILFFMYSNVIALVNINYDYHSFMVYKYLYPNSLLNIKIIHEDYYNKLYKGYNNYYYENNELKKEEHMLNKLFKGK